MELLTTGLGLVPFARPYQWNLDWFFSRADRIRLYSGGASAGRKVEGAVFICEVTPPATLAVREALRLSAFKGSPQCLCLGTIAIELWEGEKMLTTLALHHHKTLRMAGAWPLDAVLRDGPALARWLAEQGHRGELERHQADIGRQREREEDSRAIFREAPSRLCDLAKGPVPLSALASRYPGRLELCQDLLRWFGVARRRWGSGMPLEESGVDQALKEIGFDTLVEAIFQSRGDEKLLRGAARYWTDRVKELDQFRLPDAGWQLLRAGENNADILAHTVDRIRRKRLRQNPGVSHSLGVATMVAKDGPYRNLVCAAERVYGLCGTRIVDIHSGATVFDCSDSGATFCKSTSFYVALPSQGKVLQVADRAPRVWTSAERQDRPQMISTTHPYMSAWSDGEYSITSGMGVILNSPCPIRGAFLSDKWLYWTTDSQVLRQPLEPPNSGPEVLLERACRLLFSMNDQLVAVGGDGSIWLDRDQIGQATHEPLALAVDGDCIYLLTRQVDGNWALEHPREGVLAKGLPPAQHPSIALTTSHLLGAFGREILAFERLP